MRFQKSVYSLSILLLIVFTADLNGQFRRKKVKLSETNKIEEFINNHIQDPFMIEHIQIFHILKLYHNDVISISFAVPMETQYNPQTTPKFQ